jgi:hypothetical protein
MTRQSATLQLGKIIAKDMARGSFSPSMQDLGEALVSHPDSAVEIVELLFAESRKKRQNQALVSAFSFMLSRALESARWRKENQSLGANDLIDRVRNSVLKAAQQEGGSSEALFMVAHCFAAAKVDIGDEARHLLELAASCKPEPMMPGTAVAEFETMAGKLAKELDHDPFLIHAQINEILDSLPLGQRIQMISIVASFNLPSLREAVAGWLLDANASIANAVAGFLAQAAGKGLVSGATVNRLIVLRNWVSDDRRSAIDAVIRAARQKDVDVAQTSPIQIGDVIASGCDGAGAQSFFVVIRQKRKHSVASLLVKHGFGVRDAWVRADLTSAETQMFLDQTDFEMGGFETSLDVVQTALNHGLAVSLKAGETIPFGLLQFIELTGLSTIVPSYVNSQELLDKLLADIPADKKSDAAASRALAGSKRWQKDWDWLDSWFEDSEEALQAVRGERTIKAQTENILRNVVASRRERWAELLAWTALAARDETDTDDWIDFTLVARELLGDRPIDEIPVARCIAQNTAEAFRDRF